MSRRTETTRVLLVVLKIFHREPSRFGCPPSRSLFLASKSSLLLVAFLVAGCPSKLGLTSTVVSVRNLSVNSGGFYSRHHCLAVEDAICRHFGFRKYIRTWLQVDFFYGLNGWCFSCEGQRWR